MQIIQGDGFTVKIVRSPRRKSLAIKVNQDGASIHIPSKLPLHFAETFISKKSAWIKTKLKQQCDREPIPKQFVDGESFSLLGKTYTLQLTDDMTKPTITLTNDTLTCRAKLETASKTAISAAVIAWYKNYATDYLCLRTQQISSQINLNATSVTVKTYRARWGSCTIRGDIQLNWKLILAPAEISDYVIIHELCHTLQHNHSPQFWQLVSQHCPNYKQARLWLKENGHSLTVEPYKPN